MPSSSEVKVRFLKRAKSIRRRFEPFYLDKRYLKGLVQIHKHRGDAPCFLRAGKERTFDSAGVIWKHIQVALKNFICAGKLKW